ncbi:hypothetical protein ACFLRW_03110 [Acidobacteriota bacterium]
MTEEVINQIKDATTLMDSTAKLPCKRAFQLAEELNISLKDIGDICNAEGIKIIHCQLGCFP